MENARFFFVPGPDGNCIGRYDAEFHEEIPAGAVAVTEEIWLQELTAPGSFVFDAGSGSFAPAPPPRELTREEKIDRLIRPERNTRLAECDWTQLADSPLTATEKAAWAQHRQELRDFTATVIDPDTPQWPQAPWQ